MLRRTARQGLRAGKDLWRCQDLLCRGLINIDTEDTVPTPAAAGDSAQARFERERASHAAHLRIVLPVLVPVALIFAIAAFFLVLPYGGLQIASVIAALAAIGVLYLVARSPRDVVNWERGAEAERRVGAKLNSLEPAGFVTLYDRRFPGRGGNIDAITVGPPGVFVVETKWRRKGVEIVNGRLEIGGREDDDVLSQVVEEAVRVQVSVAPEMNEHRLTVTPVLCFVGKNVGGGDRSRGVLVTGEANVARRIASLPAVLPPDAVQQIATGLDKALPRNGR